MRLRDQRAFLLIRRLNRTKTRCSRFDWREIVAIQRDKQVLHFERASSSKGALLWDDAKAPPDFILDFIFKLEIRFAGAAPAAAPLSSNN